MGINSINLATGPGADIWEYTRYQPGYGGGYIYCILCIWEYTASTCLRGRVYIYEYSV